jgi:initiation factor 1A
MVKNQKGGNKSKKMGRKFLSAPIDRHVRVAEEKGEIYGVVTKLLGNGMFYVNDPDGKERLVVMRNKFCGRGKRDNVVVQGGWVLIGERDFESCAKPKHDLLEVYNDSEKIKLKNSGNVLISKLKSEFDKNDNDDDDNAFEFTDKNDEEYSELIQEIDETDHVETILMDTGEEVDIDDI